VAAISVARNKQELNRHTVRQEILKTNKKKQNQNEKNKIFNFNHFTPAIDGTIHRSHFIQSKPLGG
jgi:hypothetical protein